MIVKEIKIKKKNVEVICSENIVFELSLDTYSSNYILIGESIDQRRINELKKSDEISKKVIIKVGDKIDTKIIKFNPQDKRISLGLPTDEV